MRMITIQGELYSSKNSRQIFRNKKTEATFVSKSAVSKRNEGELLQILPLYRKKFLSMLEGKKKPYRIGFKIYRKTKRRFDYINIIQNIFDCMVKSGWLEDDDANNVIPFFEPYEVDSKNPRVDIFIVDNINK